MATLLLVVIYAAFIGLGIPDSLFGAAWPAISNEFSAPVSWANFVTLIISAGTVVSSLLSAKIISRFGTAAVTAGSTLMTAAALFGFSLSTNMLWLCLFSVPLGFGAGCIDTALNNYVALHYKASHMNFLHCFYGIGVSLSPFFMSMALSKSSWHEGYGFVSAIQLGIAVITVVTLPVWKKAHPDAKHGDGGSRVTLGFLSLLRDRKVRMACCVFLGSCGLEYTCGVWGSTYLVRSRGESADAAALLIMFYYMGIAFSRFLSGLLSGRVSGLWIIKAGYVTVLAAVVLLMLPLPPQAAAFSLFLIGLGNGPVFPNMLHLTPKNFGEEASQAVIGVQMASAYVGIMAAPAVFGLIAQNADVSLFPYFTAVFYAIMVLSFIGMSKAESTLVGKNE